MYSQIAANKRKTVFMIGVFLVLVGALAWVFSEFWIGRPTFTIPILIGALIYAIISYYTASKVALSLNGAQPIAKKDNPRLYRLVENLSITDGLPTPKIYIITDPAPNAFATGRDPDHASVAVTSGLLAMMDDTELQGVLAHELGHVKNYDIRVSMVVFGLVAAVSLIADIMLRMTWFRDNDNENNSAFMILGIVAAICYQIG